MDENERIDDIIEILNGMRRNRFLTNMSWSPAEQERYNQLVNELNNLINTKIQELEDEKTRLEKEYPNFSKRLKYFFKVPEKVISAEIRYYQIVDEIERFKNYPYFSS